MMVKSRNNKNVSVKRSKLTTKNIYWFFPLFFFLPQTTVKSRGRQYYLRSARKIYNIASVSLKFFIVHTYIEHYSSDVIIFKESYTMYVFDWGTFEIVLFVCYLKIITYNAGASLHKGHWSTRSSVGPFEIVFEQIYNCGFTRSLRIKISVTIKCVF